MNNNFSRFLGLMAVNAMLLMPVCKAFAGTTEISTVPLVGASSGGAPPNIMLLLDTSNSMSWSHMPDQLELVGAKQKIGYKASECNALYYNPNRLYTVPRDSANAALPTPSFTAAPYNYYAPDTADIGRTVNLGTSFQAHDAKTVQNVVTAVADTAQAAYYFVFVPTSAAPAYTYNSSPCNDTDTWAAGSSGLGSATTGGKWKRVLVSTTSGPVGRLDERSNFAIWYTYYRTRISLAKSSIGLAFAPLSDTYRVGLITVNPTLGADNVTVNTSVQDAHYTPLSDFNSAQRSSWYTKFYSQKPAGSSPAREGLARVGRHYAGQTDGINTGMNTDPVQYACQKNFTIMTTDGYWNVAAEKAGVSGGPTNKAGNAWVGQQDGNQARPLVAGGPVDHPLTLDTDPNGLVPAGVFDGTLPQLGYTKTGQTTTAYTFPSCTYTTPGYTTTTVNQTVRPQIKTVVTTPPQNATKLQSRTVSFTRTSYLMTKQTLQYVIPTSTKSTTQFIWYNPAAEVSQPVLSCSGLTNCTNSALTGTASVPTGSCVAQDPVAPDYIRVTCSGATSAIQSAACTVGVNGCQVNTIVAPTFVAANGCSAVNSGSPNYQITTCTINAPTTPSPSTSTSAAVITTVNANCGATYAAGGNVVCSNASGFPTGWVDNPTCVAATINSATATECQTVSYCNTAVTPFPASCATTTVSTVPNPNGVACAASTVTTASGTVTTSCSLGTPTVTNAVNPATCTIGTTNPGAGNNYNQVVCQQNTTAAVALNGLTCPDPATLVNGWTSRTCATATVTGWKKRSTITTTQDWTYDNGTVVSQTPTNSSADLTSCLALPVVVSTPPLPNPVQAAPQYVAPSPTGGSVNSLADVAQYYYTTDLRPDMSNIVPPTGSGPLDDRVRWQHMSTYVVGLGVSGTLPYKADYATSGTGSFADIRRLSQSWPVWPDPALNYTLDATLWNSAKSIDDFWHTAVNGRGKYFSASDPDAVVTGIRSALDAISATVGSSTATTISDQLNSTITGLNFASSYQTLNWVGDVQAYNSGDLSIVTWSAQAKLDLQTGTDCDNRRIYVRDTSGTNNLSNFTVATKKCSDSTVSTGLSSAMQAKLSAASLTQYGTMNAAQQGQATVASLVNFLRGQRQNEGYAVGQSGKLYRSRTHVLGDIVNSKPQFVGAPYFDFVDDGYFAFKLANASRQNMIYAGANDGMLHAIYAPPSTADSTQLAKQGQEAWAYIPTAMIISPDTTKVPHGVISSLADVGYPSHHKFFVDGTPTVGDVKFADGTWHTILVGGLGGGGASYYALDITDPATPKSLWELDNTNCSGSGCSLGYTFGAPVIGKMANGTWAVFVTSGYNNSTGQASLFVLNAETGASIKTMNAGSADPSAPLGLAQISAWSNLPNLDRTVSRVYGGDLQGNLWRFDVNTAGSDAVYKIGILKDPSNAVQPITTPPELGKIGSKAYVYVGTGQLLGSSDFGNTQQQTVYGIYDDLAASDKTDSLRSVLTNYVTTSDLRIACASGASCSTVSSRGFLIDMIGSGEKVITPVSLVGTTLVIISSQPQDNTCGSGGSSKVYFADATNGTAVGTGVDLGNTVVGVIYLNSSGQTVTGLVRFGSQSDGSSGSGSGVAGGGTQSFTVPTGVQPPGTTRASWREIIQR
jgi:Tfp pilus tip-associated adhesin PilY1